MTDVIVETSTSVDVIVQTVIETQILSIAEQGPPGPQPTLSSTTPSMDGVAAVGDEATASHGNHVHPSDTSRLAASAISSWALAATKPVYTYSEVGAASTTDARLSDARVASDVSAWAKASTKPAYTASEVGALAAGGTAADSAKLGGAAAADFATQSWVGSNYTTFPGFGNTSATACVGNDARLSDSRPASDVSAWAKNGTKPSYTYSEVGSVASDDARLTNSRPASDVSAWAKSATKPAYTYSEVGAASTTDARLSDARVSSDVSAWAKAATKPSYTASEVGLGTGDSPTFAGLTTPTVTGGSGTTQTLTYKTTTGVGAAGADHVFLVGNNGGTEAMRILNNGNVGIGNSSPGAKLDVTGTIRASGAISTTGGSFVAADNYTYSWGGKSTYIQGNSTTGLLSFCTANTTWATIDSVGQVKISATTASSGSASGSLVNAGGFGNAGAIFGGSLISAATQFQIGATKVVGAQVAAIGLNAKSDANKITDIIAALRSHGLLGPDA